MRIIPILLVIFSFSSFASPDESLAVGNWKCDSFTVGEGDEDIFDVSHTVEYRVDGTSTDIHVYRLKGMEDDVWLKVSHSGPWKINGNTITEKAVKTIILDASIPELKNSVEILEAISYEGEVFISEIIELSQSRFITKDKELEEAGTCVKV
ncbi:hypothetical protein [Colwellia sp. Bg11-28]|uniref:hypothetical protein n=1 Tax=Colwellia sp. Bg11-28 TaxID=2058305 RepID=UPI000C346713|nr:hypothetical protein [Colwellia sp. Bg11-28]PKH88652.1 hypothetical protein CXF79_04560 [Colwellia sp. Bg11-28]